ncbi:YraN family protein [Lichenihabitans psoromatis]|uniref:YraN family protein n=1 Tax=Lichenihabitans psoromatis TaxID=2528642 RepID=UPI001FDEF63C|nr:YraN family protein [Lichenihabitans psoromatis]
MTRDRAIANAFGLRAEMVATLLLVCKGYWPLARNYKVRGGEIDIIARRGGTVIFAEVKARPRLADAMVAISATKRQRIERAARVWLSSNPWAAHCVLRGDGVFVAPRAWPRHVEDAFRLNLM